jgi:hypothetical protein
MRKYNITNYKINEDMSIDVIGDISTCSNITKLPLQFNIVKAALFVVENNLTSLEGSPVKVTGRATSVKTT